MRTEEPVKAFQQSFVQFIKRKFCSPYKIDGKEVSRNDYSKESGISRATLTRFNDGNAYDVPISTIYKLCDFEKITMTKLLTEFEENGKVDKDGLSDQGD